MQRERMLPSPLCWRWWIRNTKPRGRNHSYLPKSNKHVILLGKQKVLMHWNSRYEGHRSTHEVRVWIYSGDNKRGKEWVEAWQGEKFCLDLVKWQLLSRYLRKNTWQAGTCEWLLHKHPLPRTTMLSWRRKTAVPVRAPFLCRLASGCSMGRRLWMGIYKTDKEHNKLGQDKYSEIYLEKSLLTLKPKM